MDKINSVADLVAYLMRRWQELAAERDQYDKEHPDGAEDIEDEITEGSMSGAEGEIATLLRMVGENPFPEEGRP